LGEREREGEEKGTGFGREREVKLIGVAWATEEKEDGVGMGKWRTNIDVSPPPDFRRLKSRRCVKTNGCILKFFSLFRLTLPVSHEKK
jgi:hypothetical protein